MGGNSVWMTDIAADIVAHVNGVMTLECGADWGIQCGLACKGGTSAIIDFIKQYAELIKKARTPTSVPNTPTPPKLPPYPWPDPYRDGKTKGMCTYKNTGGVYDPATDTWIRATSTVNGPSARGYQSAVWTGSRMLIWGGKHPGNFGDGYFYDPSADAWAGTTSTVGAPTAAAVWTGREMIVWGGGSEGPHLDTGGRYNPATDTWTGATTLVNVSEPKASFVGVWTGWRMIVWGGASNDVLSNEGALYRPPLPAEGPNPATITITAPGASNSPQVIRVQLTVTP